MSFEEAVGRVVCAFYLQRPIDEDQQDAVLAALPQPWRRVDSRTGELCLGCIMASIKLGAPR